MTTTGHFLYYYKTPIGPLGFMAENDVLTHILFPDVPIPHSAVIQETPVILQAFDEVSEYLNGDRQAFDVPMNTKGTPFQEAVWQTLLTIPYGTTINYQELAARNGKPKAVRAVGMACHRNPLPILIPCHRVIAKNGELNGYAGPSGLKQTLLDLERLNQ